MIPRLLTLAFLLLFSSLTSAQRTQPRRQPIIDVHLHNYSTDELLKNQAPNPVTGKPNGLATENAHMQATLAAMERFNIVKGVVSNNQAVGLRWKTTAPDRVIISYGIRLRSKLSIGPVATARGSDTVKHFLCKAQILLFLVAPEAAVFIIIAHVVFAETTRSHRVGPEHGQRPV